MTQNPLEKPQFKIIAYYQIIGGIYGLYVSLTVLAKQQTLSGLSLIIYLLTIGLYIFAIYSGNLLRLQKQKGIELTKWSQLTQLLQFNIAGVAFWYISGIGISIGYGEVDDLIQFLYLNVSSMYFKYKLTDSQNFYFFINLIPLLVIYFLEPLHKRKEKKN